jgi:ABC-type amino acid transport substrate-binding protein
MRILKVFLCFFVSILCAKEEKFVVGMASGYAPYVSLNEKGEYEGFDVDLAKMVAGKIHRQLVLQDLGSMPSLLVALKKERIDAIIWAMSITEERKKEMNMVYYQGDKETQIPFIFWNQVPENVKEIQDLEKMPKCTVCCEAGSSQDTVLRRYPKVNVKYLDKISDALMDLKYKKAQAVVIDGSLIPRVTAQYPEVKVTYLPLPDNLQSFGNGICLNRKSEKLTQEVEKAIAELTQEGKIGELEKKWGLSK